MKSFVKRRHVNYDVRMGHIAVTEQKGRIMLDLDELQDDPASILHLKADDPVLQKLETYRLYRAGHSATEIAKAFGFARPYLYDLWRRFEEEGAVAFVKKNWGTAPQKLTSEVEAAVIRAKAIDPMRSDSDLAREFGLSRSRVFRLLQEHGIQDLHKCVRR